MTTDVSRPRATGHDRPQVTSPAGSVRRPRAYRAATRSPQWWRAVATSGTAARGSHLLDPSTGRAVTDLLSVTVTGPSLLWADVPATAAFAAGPGAVQWLVGLADHSGLVVDAAGTVTRVRWVAATNSA